MRPLSLKMLWLVVAHALVMRPPPRVQMRVSSSLEQEETKIPAALQAKIEEYLAVRAARIDKQRTLREKQLEERAATMANPVWRALNYMLSVNSLLPDVPDEDPNQDPLSYTELERFGYSSLIDDIMTAGGHIKVSKALGLEVLGRSKPKRPAFADIPKPKVQQGGLALGAALDERLDAVTDLNLTRVKEDRDRRPRQASRARESRDAAVVQRRDTTDAVIVPKEWPALLAPLSLGPLGRMYGVLALVLFAADPQATATAQAEAALAPYFDSAAVFDTMHTASFAVLAANVAAAGIVVFQRRGDRPLFALARTLFGGPFALLDQRK